jgi:competence protein ComEA
MNKASLELSMGQIHREDIQDKRTLVLFVLGLLLLISDFCSFADHETGRFDTILLEKTARQWRLTSTPVVADADSHRQQNCTFASEVQGLPVICSQDAAVDDVPAELFLFFNKPLPINRASQGALEMLPGVGPHLATAISATLQRTGKFTGPDDLLKVPGIGPKSLKRLLPLISFE